MEWLEKVRGAKPATIRPHQSDLAEPGTPHKRDTGTTAGLTVAALGDKPAARMSPAQVEAVLRTVARAPHDVGALKAGNRPWRLAIREFVRLVRVCLRAEVPAQAGSIRPNRGASGIAPWCGAGVG
jgi:hypothetical protein